MKMNGKRTVTGAPSRGLGKRHFRTVFATQAPSSR